MNMKKNQNAQKAFNKYIKTTNLNVTSYEQVFIDAYNLGMRSTIKDKSDNICYTQSL